MIQGLDNCFGFAFRWRSKGRMLVDYFVKAVKEFRKSSIYIMKDLIGKTENSDRFYPRLYYHS